MIEIASSHPLIRVYTFGEFYIERLTDNNSSLNNEPCYERVAREEWRSRGPAISLLKLLVCRTNRRVTRDVILDTLWPEIDAEKAAKSLDVAASILRSILRAGNERNLLISTHSGDVSTVGLPNQQTIWVDADAFDSHLAYAARAEQEGKDHAEYVDDRQ